MKPFDEDAIKKEILSGEENRIILALRRGRMLGYDTDKYYSSLLEICSFLEDKNKQLYSISVLKTELKTKGLKLNGMKLQSLPDCFAALSDMTDSIDISQNEISELPLALYEFKHLKKLNLSDNKLRELPGSFAQFASLEELNLSANLFLKLPDILSKFETLKSLKVDVANPSFFKFGLPKNIEQLYLNFFKTISFPENLVICNKLKVLVLEGISELDAEVVKLHSLEKLHIERSGLETLPDFISNLSNLKALSLCNLLMMNKIPEVIFKLQNLEVLDLSGTPILELSAKIRLMKNLKYIKFSGCNDKDTLLHWKKRAKSWGLIVLS